MPDSIDGSTGCSVTERCLHRLHRSECRFHLPPPAVRDTNTTTQESVWTYYATLSKNLEPVLHVPIAPYAGAAYGTFNDRLRFIGGLNLSVTDNLSALVTYNGEHYNSILSLSRGRYTGSLLYVSGGDVGAAWNVTW